MKLRDIKEWIESLPIDFLEYDVVNGEVGDLDGELSYRLDKPIIALTVDEQNCEIVFLNQESK